MITMSDERVIPCSVNSAEFPYITLKRKLVPRFSRNVNRVVSKAVQVKL